MTISLTFDLTSNYHDYNQLVKKMIPNFHSHVSEMGYIFLSFCPMLKTMPFLERTDIFASNTNPTDF